MPYDPPDATRSHADGSPADPEGAEFALVLEAEERGDWAPVVDWLARRPDRAADLLGCVAAGRRMGALLGMPVPARTPGSALGDFEILEEIGRGGMGVVYRARDRRLGRVVALKVTRGALSATERARLRFEAESMAESSHPNVVPVFASGEANGEPYLVMPLMTGSLAGWLKDRLTAPTKAAEIVRDIARGVHHAHQRGLIHRDLKPANILLDAEGTPRVADFGLARRADATATGIAGAPAYMAPEQARGDKYLTTAVDVHALGMILFELLTGRTPFGGGDIAAVLRRVIEEPAPSVRSLRRDVSKDLAAVCAKCLEKEPARRYASAQELADDIQRFLSGEPVCARLPGIWGKAVRAVLWQQFDNPRAWGYLSLWTGGLTVVWYLFFAWAVFTRLPREPFLVAAAVHAIALAGLYWAILRRARFRAGDRHTLTVVVGVLVATFLLPIVYRPPEGGDVTAYRLSLYPLIALFTGLFYLALAAPFWGGYYLIGAGYFALALVIKAVPALGPWVFAIGYGGVTMLIGLYLIRLDRGAEPDGRPSSPAVGTETVTTAQPPGSTSGQSHT